MISILGLPGLYQNWLRATLDPDSQFSISHKINFNTHKSTVNWYKKLETDIDSIDQDSIVINTYVADRNFVWYLYNFLEKTDAVNIKVESLVEDLKSKAVGTMAFDTLLTHFVESYNLNSHPDIEYKNNAAIEYFYFLLLDQDSRFKKITSLTNSKFINIEYLDFSNYDILKQKLLLIECIDLIHVDKMYQLLQQENLPYLKRQHNFLKKLKSNHKDFDILEQSYIGALLTWQSGIVYDWFNPDVRSAAIADQWNKICDTAVLQ
jgi:hypothetical protein